MKYRPEAPPRGATSDQLAEYLQRELQRLAETVEQVEDLNKDYAAPPRLIDGMLRYADGTTWNPDSASGEGFYGYWASAWHFLGAGPGMSFGSISGLANSNVNGSASTAARSDHQHKRDVRVAKAGTDVGTRNRINLIEGSNVTLTVSDDSGNDEVDVTIAASSGGAGKRTIWIPASAMLARVTSGAGLETIETSTNKLNLRTLNFDSAATEYVQFTVRMPKSWNESTVTAQFVWSHAATTTNFGVVWGAQAIAISDDDALDAAFGTAQTVADTGGTTDDLYISSATSAITIGGTPAENDYVQFQAYRKHDDASDTMAIDARLHGIVIIYTTDASTDD